MRTKIKSILFAMLVLVAFTPPVALLPGCAFFSKTAPGSEAIVVNAERTAKLAFTLTDAFLDWEFQNRANVPGTVTKAADDLRDGFPPAYNAFRLATKTYKSSRLLTDRDKMDLAQSNMDRLTVPASNFLPATVRERAIAKAAMLTAPPEVAETSRMPR